MISCSVNTVCRHEGISIHSGEFPVVFYNSSFEPGPHNLTIIANSTNGKVAQYFDTFTIPDRFGITYYRLS